MVEQNRIKSLITDANSAINDYFVRLFPRRGGVMDSPSSLAKVTCNIVATFFTCRELFFLFLKCGCLRSLIGRKRFCNPIA